MNLQVFNLIILDESGSMHGFTAKTISGCNETINSIRAAQAQNADSQDHFVSIYCFQSSGDRPSRYLIKNLPIAEVNEITKDDYCPDGCTPLYDAIGATLADLKAKTAKLPLALGNVTIITDGYENSSRLYSLPQVARMISQLKELGWSFNFIGANIDVDAVASHLNIDNAMAFEQTQEGTEEMFRRERESRAKWNSRVSASFCCMRDNSLDSDGATFAAESLEELRKRFRKDSEDYFSED